MRCGHDHCFDVGSRRCRPVHNFPLHSTCDTTFTGLTLRMGLHVAQCVCWAPYHWSCGTLPPQTARATHDWNNGPIVSRIIDGIGDRFIYSHGIACKWRYMYYFVIPPTLLGTIHRHASGVGSSPSHLSRIIEHHALSMMPSIYQMDPMGQHRVHTGPDPSTHTLYSSVIYICVPQLLEPSKLA